MWSPCFFSKKPIPKWQLVRKEGGRARIAATGCQTTILRITSALSPPIRGFFGGSFLNNSCFFLRSQLIPTRQYMDVSLNGGTPKSSINHPFWGTPIFGNTHIPSLKLTVRTWKWMVGRRSSPFGPPPPIFSGECTFRRRWFLWDLGSLFQKTPYSPFNNHSYWKWEHPKVWVFFLRVFSNSCGLRSPTVGGGGFPFDPCWFCGGKNLRWCFFNMDHGTIETCVDFAVSNMFGKLQHGAFLDFLVEVDTPGAYWMLGFGWTWICWLE